MRPLICGSCLAVLLTIMIGSGCGAGSPASPADLDPRLAVNFTLDNNAAFVTRLSASVAGNRGIAVRVLDQPQELRLPPGTSGPYDLTYARGRGWQEPGPLSLRIRFADEQPGSSQEVSLDLQRSLPSLAPNCLYLLPLDETASPGEEVRVQLIQGQPLAPLDSFELNLDFTGPVEFQEGSLKRGLAPTTEFPHGWLDGAWQAYRGTSLLPHPVESGINIDASHAAQGRLRLDLGAGYSATGNISPYQAGAGALVTFSVRFARAGDYRIDFLRDSGECYFTASRQTRPGLRQVWQDLLPLPGVSNLVQVR